MRLRRLATAVLAAALAGPTWLGVTSAPAAADTTISTRVDDTDPVGVAIEVSRMRFYGGDGAGGGNRPAMHVVLSRDDDFADTLAGSPLTNDGPLLFTATDRLPEATRAEIQRLFDWSRGGGTTTGRIYVLGGPNAVSPAVIEALEADGHDVVRLAGKDRVATALAIAKQVRFLYGGQEVLLARAWGIEGSEGSGWVDSVAGGARAADKRIPVLLTPTAGLDARVADWLRRDGTTRTHLLGGPRALSQAVQDAVPGARRHHGPERTATAAAIARGLWGAKDTGPRAFTVVDASQDRGWPFAFAAAGLAADRDAPILTTIGTVTAPTQALVATCGTPQVDLTIVGDGTLVSGAVREYLDDLDGEGCGPGRSLVRRAGLQRFEDCPELLDWYRTNALERVTAWGLGHWYGGPIGVMPVDDRAGGPEAAPAAEADSGSGAAAPDFSGTNTQEADVDEPDVLKTNGRLVAVVNDDRVDLVDLTGTDPRLASSIQLGGHGSTELLLVGDVLTVMTSNMGPVWFATSEPAREDAGFAPQTQPPRVTTTVARYDVADVDAPRQLSSFEVDGWYRSARMVDGVARIVLESGPHDLDFTWPQDGSQEAHDRALAHNREVVKTSTLRNWLPAWTATSEGQGASGGDGTLLVDCGDVHEPPAWSGFDGITVVTYDTRTASTPGRAATVVATGQNVYASTQRLLVTTGRWGEVFEGERIDSVASTELHAFDISQPTDIAYVGSGKVDGYVLNQFSLSESGGDIRVAATKQPPWRNAEDGARSESFVAVLREQGSGLAEVGRVAGLGLGEQIQAVRFLGDLGVVVTFEQIDPLYLIDLRDGTAPRVTGELKDTGFAQYLHRVGDDLLLGVGVDADDEGRRLGAMAALYDIRDRTKPTRVSRVNIANASSPVGWDHRAFLHWARTADAFVPIGQWDGQQQREYSMVLRIDEAARRFTRRGDLTQAGSAKEWMGAIRRQFVVGDAVYTVSWAGLMEHDLASLKTRSWTPWPQQDHGGGEEPPPPQPL